MSISPVFAAAIGAAFLGEALAAVDRLAIGLIVSANAVAVVVTPQAAASRAEDMPVRRGDSCSSAELTETRVQRLSSDPRHPSRSSRRRSSNG